MLGVAIASTGEGFKVIRGHGSSGRWGHVSYMPPIMPPALPDVNEHSRTEAIIESTVFNVLGDIKNTDEHLKTAILA